MRVVFVLLMLLPAQPVLAQEIQKVVIRPDFGVCTVSQWKRDWPGCEYEDGVSEGHLSIVKFNDAAVYRVDYALGEIGPEKGGVGWRAPIQPSDAVELNYQVQFSEDFDWVKGGKLPGLSGGPKSVTGGNRANGTNGFSARLMWRANGRGEAYLYHMNQPGKYGESFPFPADFHFPRGKPILVRLRVGMNTPRHADGTMDVWIGDASTRKFRHVVSRSDMEWRATKKIVVDSMRFETFYGGSNKSWAPQRPSFTLFSDISTRIIDARRN